MRKCFGIVSLLTFIAVFWACSSTSNLTRGLISNEDLKISALGAIGRTEAASGPVYEGDGGVDIRLAILAPEARGDVPGYLPLYIQGLLNNNFKKYSAVTLIDRQNLDKIIAEQNIGVSGRFSDKDFVSIGQLTNTQYFLFGSVQKLSGERYSLQLSITDSRTGVRRADFMKDGLLSQIEGSGTLINEAVVYLLEQMEVRLTEMGRRFLLAGNISVVQAEAGLARGITAQAAGAEVEALFNFSQSVAFDPTQMEALSRLSILSPIISGGTISQRIVNDIQARERWLDVFKETSRFFKEHPPFEITFDPNLMQEGTTNYAKRTANIAMRIALDPSESGFSALNALLEGLEKTGKRSDWGFSGWPLLNISPKSSETLVFEGKQLINFKVDVALINENGKTVGRNSVTLNSGKMNFSSGDKTVSLPDGVREMIRFPNVKADDLTPTLTIVIVAVNGIPSRELNSTGYMRIDAGDLESNKMVRINGGTFTMGSPANEPYSKSDETQHQVTINSFYMGKYPVTQKEYQEVMGTNPSHFKGDNLPVEMVSWYDAIMFCNKLSMKEGLSPAYRINRSTNPAAWGAVPTSYNDNTRWDSVAIVAGSTGYRLPTEAQWEYACCAETRTPFSTGNNITTSQANYNGNGPYNNNAKGEFRERTTPVDSFAPNSWGLYDMHGNVWEWCWDWYGEYTSSAQTDPTGAVSGVSRVGRGGSWYSDGQYLRSAYRNFYPYYRYDYYGFRLSRP